MYLEYIHTIFCLTDINVSQKKIYNKLTLVQHKNNQKKEDEKQQQEIQKQTLNKQKK